MAKKDQTKNQSEKSTDEQAYLRAMAQIEKDHGKGSVMLLGSKGALSIPVIPTGILTLDIALGVGGMPRGRIVEIYGPESSGKTTVCAHIVAEAQKLGGRAAFVDTEHALDPEYMTNIGVNVDKLVVSQPDCGEDALDIAQTLIESNAFAIVVIDSVAALVPRAEIEGQMGDSHVGLQARLMSQALRKLVASVSRSGTCLIFTNQIREKIGVMFGNPETTTGGNALKFYASIRMDIRRGERISGADKDDVIGFHSKIKVVKNKCAPPFKKAEFDVLPPNGVDKIGCVLDVAIDLEIVEKRGAWFSMGNDQIGQGRQQAKDVLAADPKLMEILSAKVKEKLAEMKASKVVKAADAEDEGDPQDESIDSGAEEVPGDIG
jgi:recombination protein RecA